MATYTPQIASGSPGNGRMKKIAATSSPGDTLHTATNTAGEFDEVYIWIQNNDTTAREVIIQLGGTTATDDDIKQTIQPKAGFALVVPGIRLNGGVIVKAYCTTTNVLVAAVNVNRIAA